MSSLAPSRFNVVKSAIRPSTNKKRATDGNDGKESNIKVAVRIRPINNGARSFVASGNSITEVQQQQPEPTFATPRRKAASEYIYDSVYGEKSTTHEIYNEFVSNIVSSVVNDGVNGTVFSYGQTGSGKTHTMQGGDDDGDNGVIQLAANQIFDTIKQDAAAAEYKVKVSYLEIYIEDIVDLLADSNSAAPLEIRGETINNLVEREVASYEDLMRVFRRGDGKKTVGSTNMNH
jgi:kinesin family protein 18/19